MPTRSIPLYLSSDPASGSTNLSNDGSSFHVNFTPPLRMPNANEATNLRISVPEGNVWNTMVNISPEKNNDKFYYEYALLAYVITIPAGQYTFSLLSERINALVVANGQPDQLFRFFALTAEQKVQIEITNAGWAVDFTQNDTFRKLLGYSSQRLPAVGLTTGSEFFKADNSAGFSEITNLIIHSSLVSGNAYLNGKQFSGIASLHVNAPSGSIINSSPYNPIETQASHLLGNTISDAQFWLTDQKNVRINTNGDYWSLRLLLTWDDNVNPQQK